MATKMFDLIARFEQERREAVLRMLASLLHANSRLTVGQSWGGAPSVAGWSWASAKTRSIATIPVVERRRTWGDRRLRLRLCRSAQTKRR